MTRKKPKDIYSHPRTKKPMKRPEQAMQIGIMNFARRMMEINKYKDFMVFHVPNGGHRTEREATIFKQMGVMPGVADLVVLVNKTRSYDPTTFFIELKAKGGDLTEYQMQFEDRVCAMGYEYYVIEATDPSDALNQFIEIIAQYGVKLN